MCQPFCLADVEKFRFSKVLYLKTGSQVNDISHVVNAEGRVNPPGFAQHVLKDVLQDLILGQKLNLKDIRKEIGAWERT